jgi:hypothetical protein
MSISAVNTEGDTARRYTDMSVQTSPSLLPILHKTPHPQSNVERIYPQTSHFRDASSDSDYASLISGTSFLSSGFDNTSDLRSSSLESFPSSQEWNDIVPSSKIRKPYSLHPVRRVPSTPFHSKLFSNSYSSRTVSLPERSSLKSSFAAIIPSPRTVSLPIQLTEGPFSNLSDISESSFSVSEPSFTTHSAPNPQTPTKRDVRYTHDLIDLRTPSPALSPPISYLGSFAAGSASPSLSFVDASTFDDDSVVFVSEDLTIPRSPVAEHPPPSALAVQLEPAPSSNEIHADKYGTYNSLPNNCVLISSYSIASSTRLAYVELPTKTDTSSSWSSFTSLRTMSFVRFVILRSFCYAHTFHVEEPKVHFFTNNPPLLILCGVSILLQKRIAQIKIVLVIILLCYLLFRSQSR